MVVKVASSSAVMISWLKRIINLSWVFRDFQVWKMSYSWVSWWFHSYHLSSVVIIPWLLAYFYVHQLITDCWHIFIAPVDNWSVCIFPVAPVDDWLLAYFQLNQLTPINLHIEYGVRADLCFLNNLSEFTAYFLITDDLVICNSFRKYYKYKLPVIRTFRYFV